MANINQVYTQRAGMRPQGIGKLGDLAKLQSLNVILVAYTAIFDFI